MKTSITKLKNISEWRKRNPDKVKNAANKYARANRQKHLAYIKDYRIKFPFVKCLRSAKGRAIKYGYEFNLDREWAENVWTGKCSLTGIEFIVSPNRHTVYTPSIDRVDNTKGYIKDNCRFILFGINMLKYTSTDVDMYKLAAALVANKPKLL